MTLDYSESGFLKLDMTDYVAKILNEMPEDMNGTATSPAAVNTFSIL
jgi:hypothetical protein